MDTTERQVIDDIFRKIRQAEAASLPRDAQAEQYINTRIREQPAAPYYMAQVMIIQEQALVAAQARAEELARRLAERPAGGGFLAGLFGGSGVSRASGTVDPRRISGYDPRVVPYADPRSDQGRTGFLGGAMQTAMGVAGGLLIGSALTSLFATDAPADEDFAGDGDIDDGGDGLDGEF